VDIWGIGLILGEMLRMKDHKGQFKKLTLFKGSSCYPISPSNEKDEHVVEHDD